MTLPKAQSLKPKAGWIAQKARRLDTSKLDEEEARHLVRHLQETFEVYKSSIFEPSNRAFEKAQKILPKLRPLPFDIDGAGA